MNKKSKTIDRCQISGAKDLKTILSLGYLPPVNKLKKINRVRVNLNQKILIRKTVSELQKNHCPLFKSYS